MKRRRTTEFPRTPGSVPRARAWLEDQLNQLAPAPGDEVVDRALLGLSEIVTNAVQHGGGRRIFVTYTVLDDMVTIESLDGGKGGTLPAVQGLPADTADGGRGLCIVDAISGGDWSWDTRMAGRMRVSFRLKLDQKAVQE